MRRPILFMILFGVLMIFRLDSSFGEFAAALQGQAPHPWRTAFDAVVVTAYALAFADTARRVWMRPKLGDTRLR